MTDIPERQPIRDEIEGFVVDINGIQAFMLEIADELDVIASGQFIVRYGVQFLGKPQLSIVPGLIALDYGEMLTGEEAWDFLWNRSNLHPRADVFGYRNDGEDDMIVIKWLDVDQSAHVLFYDTENATKPVASPQIMIASDDDGLPQRFTQHLPRYDSIAKWQAELEDE